MSINEQSEPFGAWLLKQAGRDDWIGTLAKQAKGDPKFQKSLTPDDLRKRLHDAGPRVTHSRRWMTPKPNG
ncbi:hypothetical protein ACKU27_00865 [Sphingobium yanoikuyae]|uniref:hypothetical protein n=1 Tax=Sphingobium yanoikuyae TaxID=13690 RepID=UPI003B8F1721